MKETKGIDMKDIDTLYAPKSGDETEKLMDTEDDKENEWSPFYIYIFELFY